jgi:archaellum component FlaF (FlaF/FlaG flagellin family)
MISSVGAPAFSAYASSNTTLTNATFVKVNFQTEEFDTNNNFASSRFTPTVAGYYLLQTGVCFTGSATSESEIGLYKNGSALRYGMDIITAGGSVLYNMQGNWLVYANGSTDYFEIYMYQNSSRDVSASQFQTYFTGAMVRSA